MVNIKRLYIIIAMALVAFVAFYYLCRVKDPTFHERTRQGHTMVQWLTILKINTNSIDDPLKIVDGAYEPGIFKFEVALSYDLLKKYDFMEGSGRPHIVINERLLTPGCDRATNGNLILVCDWHDISSGTNHVQAELEIYEMKSTAPAITATGPVFDFVPHKSFTNHHLQQNLGL